MDRLLSFSSSFRALTDHGHLVLWKTFNQTSHPSDRVAYPAATVLAQQRSVTEPVRGGSSGNNDGSPASPRSLRRPRPVLHNRLASTAVRSQPGPMPGLERAIFQRIVNLDHPFFISFRSQIPPYSRRQPNLFVNAQRTHSRMGSSLQCHLLSTSIASVFYKCST